MKNKLKVEIYHKARYVGDNSPEFEPLKIYVANGWCFNGAS